MNKQPKFTILIPLFVVAGVLSLAACGGAPDPIPVYVTPTPVVEPTASSTPALTSADSTLAQARFAQGTPTVPPTTSGVQFGPIVGPQYTPEPRYTPLPDSVSVRPCTLAVVAPQVTLYAAAEAGAGSLGVVYAGESLGVTGVVTDEAGGQWANTDRGWIALVENGTQAARLATLRSCEILLGNDPDTTLMGFHIFSATGADTVLNFVRRMVQAGRPLGTVKGLNGTEGLLNEIKRISPETVVVYRSLLSDDGFGDCPSNVRKEPDPAATARRWMDGLARYWDDVDADYYEYINECPVALEWTVAFTLEAMKIANEEGRCLLLFSFSGGTPAIEEFDLLRPVYQYALENPCQPGRTHGIALHAYSMEDSRLVSETDEWLSLRHRKLNDRLEVTLPQAAALPVYYTEVGIGGGQMMPSCDDLIRDVLQYTYLLEEDPYVKGFHLWNVGSGGEWYDITPCLPQLSDALIAYYGDVG